MMLSAFVVAQIVFDVSLLALVAFYVVTRKPPPPLAPPEWYAHFLKLAQEVIAATELPFDGPAGRAAPAPPPPPPRDRYHEARALLAAGALPDEVAGRAGLLPGEVRLLARVVAAEAGRPAARRSG
jgi:hypothetical protein